MKCHQQQYVCLLIQVILFVANCFAENFILNVNFKKPIAITSDAFLSFTLDPVTMLHNTDTLTKNIERSTNMARGLAPAYVRIGGPQSNSYMFEQAYSYDTDPSYMFYGTPWTLMHKWAQNAGLDVIACITPHYVENESKIYSKDPTNITKLLSFNDHMGYNVSWQLGYECQTRCDISGEDLGRYVVNLREILKTFPKYSNNLITGPDIVAYRTANQQKYLLDYLNSAEAALSAITWHPNFASVSLNNDSILVHYDNIAVEKDEMYKIITHMTRKKPLWIAESKPEKCKHQYLGALIWTRRLGNAAKLGIQVVMRQPSDLFKTTPDYWVSLLHKTLVGREVLEMRFQSNNKSHVHFYSQCTKPSALYNKGALTIFGVNLTPRKVIASLKDLKIKTLHKYIISSDSEIGNKMFSEKVFLNNKPLDLINDEKLPNLNPDIIINPDGLELKLSSGNIGFWVIPDAKIKACTYPEEETIIAENIIAKKLLKQHENVIRQDNQEGTEEDISQPNLKNRKIYARQSRRKENADNEKTENQQKVWDNKLLARITKVLRKRLEKRQEKSDPSNLQRPLTIVFAEEQESSSEKTEIQQNLNRNFKRAEIDYKPEDIRDTLKKYKHTLLEKKAQMEAEYDKDLESEMQNIDNAIALLSKIDNLLQIDEGKITSDASTISEMKYETKNEERLVIGTNKKLHEYLSALENSAKTKMNITEEIEKNFNILFNLLEDIESTKKNMKNQVSVHESSMPKTRFRRNLNKKPKDSRKIEISEKRLRMDDLKKHVVKRKIKRKNEDKKEIIPSSNSDNPIKNFNDDKSNFRSQFQQSPLKKFLKRDALAVYYTDYQHSLQERRRMKKDNVFRKYLKINEMEDYQSSMQEPARTRRDADKKQVEISLKKDNVFMRRSRIDEMRDYINERKTKRKDNSRKEGSLIPFNVRTTDSSENNFYGFFRQEPIKGFPESDIFVTTGDSLEQNDKDYDYVEDENDNNNGSKKKNAQHAQKSMQDHAEDETSIEIEDEYCDYIPNEFFENVKSSNTKVKESSKNYDDLWEAEFFSEKHGNDQNNNNNGIIVAEILQKQPPDEKKPEETRTMEKNMQKVVSYYDDSDEHHQHTKYKTVGLALRHSSSPLDQLFKIPTYINRQTSNMEPEEVKLKMEPELKASSSFYQPSQVSAAKYNYSNYQTSDIRHDEDKLNEEKNSNVNLHKLAEVYMEYPIHDTTLHNRRAKRSNWEKLRKILDEEMIKEDEENARDCHCRVIRASNSPKKLCYHRVKRNNQESTTPFVDSSLEIKNVNADIEQAKRNVEDLITKEKYEEIIAGEILPSTSVIDSDYEEYDTTTEIITAELSKLSHTSTTYPHTSSTTQTIDVTSTSALNDSETNNISEQHYNIEKSTIKILVESVLDSSVLELSPNKPPNIVKKESFFRIESSNVQLENETTTYGPLQTISKIYLENRNNQDRLVASATKNTQETHEKTQNLINKKQNLKIESNSTISATVTEDKKNEERRDNNQKINLKSINSLQKTTERIVEKKVTSEMILLKRDVDRLVDNLRSNESETKLNIQQKIEDTQNSTSETQAQLRKNNETKRLKTTLRNIPKAPLRELSRYEEYLIRRAEQIEKLKEKLYAKREKILHQYHNELTKFADKHKRNLKKRDTWGIFRDSDDFRRLINQGEFVGILIDDDVISEDDNKKYVIPIKFTSKQYDNILGQIHSIAKVKEVRYPKYNKYYQFLQHQKVVGDDEKSVEASRSSDHKYNQYYEYLPQTVEDEQESTEGISRPFNHRIFIIDPSTYRGGEPILQLHEDYSEFKKKYRSKIKPQTQNSSSRWILRNFYQASPRSKLDGNQYQASKLQENMKSPIKGWHTQGNTDVLYVLDAQKQYNVPKKYMGFPRVLLGSFDQRGINLSIHNEAAGRLNNIYRNLKAEYDYLDSLDAYPTDEEIGLAKDSGIKKNIEDEEFAKSNDGKKDLTISESTKDTKNTEEKIELAEDAKTKGEIGNKKNPTNSYDKKENILNVETVGDIKNAEKMTVARNDMDNEKILNIKKAQDAIESVKTEQLNNRGEDIVEDRIVQGIKEINKSYNANDETKNNLNIRTFNNNKENEDAEKVIDGDPKAGKLEKEDAQIRLTRIDARDRPNRDTCVRLKQNSKEIFSKQSIPLFLLTKKDELPSSAVLFQKPKSYLASTKKDFEINQQDEKEYKSPINQQDERKYKPPKYIVLIPTKIKDIYPYEMLEIKDYDDSTESSKVPTRLNNQYLSRKMAESMAKYSNEESSEELEYEDVSDLLCENNKTTLDEEVHSLENEQDVSVDIKDSGVDYELKKEDEQYKVKNEEINKNLEIKDQIRSDEREMFLLFPWRNQKRRQRRHINEGISKMNFYKVQSKLNRPILAQNIADECIECYLNKNNTDKKEKEENIIKKKNTRENYLQPQINKRNRNNLSEDFIKAHKKNDLYTNEISFTENEKKNESLKNNILKNDTNVQFFIEEIPKLQNSVVNDLEKTKNFTKSMEHFIDNFEKNFNGTLTSDGNSNLENNTSETIGNVFDVAIMNVKRLFALFSRISRIFIYN